MATRMILSPMQMVDLRECWDHEALDFTPWLAGNLSLLGEVIGMELELVGTEQSVGGFNADILCRNTGTAEWVLIENQLAGTDHSHLGQLLTYTAGLHATTVIWITRQFREEHRAAIDWLNENTVPEVRFFGLEIQLWRIGGGDTVAPKFNIVCQPNNYSKIVTAQKEVESTSGAATKTSYRLRYWQAMVERLKTVQQTPLKPQTPKDQNWFSFSVGRSGFSINPCIIPRLKLVRTELYLSTINAKHHFHLLLAKKVEIEEELGPLEWDELPSGQDSRIAVYFRNVDPTAEDDWPEQHDWLLTNCLAFYKAFHPRIAALQVSKNSIIAALDTNDDAADA